MNAGCAFSVIVPTYNRVASLEACLRGLAALSFPTARFQVIVVNDGGVEIPTELQNSFRRELDVQFHSQTNSGPAAARNRGASFAQGHWLVFTDDDCVPSPGWLSELADAATKVECAVLGGSVVNGVSGNPEAEASQLLFAHLYRYYHLSHKRRSQRPFFTSNNLAVPRSIFGSIGGFEPAMRNAEDRELCARLHTEGLALRYVPAAQVVHHRPMNLREFWRLHTSYGRGGYDFYRRQKSRGVLKFEPEGPGFYVDLLLYPWRQNPRHSALELSGLLALSQIANGFGFVQAMGRARRDLSRHN